MTPKERVLCAINHQEPDKIPIDSWLSTELFKEMAGLLDINIKEDPFALKAILGDDLLYKFYGGGIWQVFDSINRPERKIQGELNIYSTPWGVKIRKAPYEYGAYAEIVESPLSNLKNYDAYKFPDPEIVEKKNYQLQELAIKKYGKTHAIVGPVPCTIFEACWFLRGLENFMVDLIDQEDFVNDIMDKAVEYHLEVSKTFVKMGVDIIWWGDDIGGEEGPMISPAHWKKYLKPRYAKMVEEVKKINKNVKIAFHSDGYIEHAIEDFIEIGFDILNPLQPEMNDVAMIKKKYGDKLTFWGNVNTRSILSNGRPEDVINEIKNVIKVLAPGGGFILCTNHKMQSSERALDNAITYYWALEKLRNYPIGF